MAGAGAVARARVAERHSVAERPAWVRRSAQISAVDPRTFGRVPSIVENNVTGLDAGDRACLSSETLLWIRRVRAACHRSGWTSRLR